MSAVETLPTVEEFTAQLQEVREKLATLTVHESYTIDDYPIGGANRGKCKLWTEHKKNNGYRMARATTDKRGRWCNPKKSTYYDLAVIAVVTGPLVTREAGWLVISSRLIYITSASWGESIDLFKAPCTSKPRREPRPYTVNGEPHELPADPKELCDLWDVWQPAVLELLNQYHEKIKEVSSQ